MNTTRFKHSIWKQLSLFQKKTFLSDQNYLCFGSCRFFCAESYTGMHSLGRFKAAPSQGSLSIDFRQMLGPINVKVISEWNDELEILIKENQKPTLDDFEFHAGHDTGDFLLKLPSNQSVTSNGNSEIRACIPNQFNLEVAINQGNIIVPNEVKGDVELSTNDGNIMVKKLQGATITVLAPNGHVDVSKVAEGAVEIHAVKVSAKMLKGRSINIIGQEDISIGAIYSPEATVASQKRAVEVGGIHGSMRVETSDGDIDIHDVNGSISGGSLNGSIKVHLNALEVDSVNNLESDKGNVEVTVAPDLEVSVEANSGKEVMLKDLSFHGMSSKTSAKGIIEKDDMQQIQAGSGKVDFREAKTQAMKGYFSPSSSKSRQNSKLDQSLGTNDHTHQSKEKLPRLLAKSRQGNVCLSRLSWMDSIKKRFAVHEE